ncbi:MAG: hypothetical protein Ta2B_17350 [Termitinemataceae bacterium]|nr:MAG: hypothetical protein Ta2B_17350 [Termitinemataceae bacterium]
MLQTVRQKLFTQLFSINWLRKIYYSIIPFSIRAHIWENMNVDEKEAKELTSHVLTHIKNSKPTGGGTDKTEKIIEILEKNRFGICSVELTEFYYDKKLKAYNFNDVILPKNTNTFFEWSTFCDSLLFNTLLNDDYSKEIVTKIEQLMTEGPYGYIDDDFKVLVEPNDVVIDAGAYIGDFSAYAASKGAICYAFEPVSEIYEMLCKTNELNTNKFISVKYGLGNKNCGVPISVNTSNGTSTIHFDKEISGKESKRMKTEMIKISTLDAFVEENNISRINFIKADIEGAERDMLNGAKNVLKNFAPKLAICTYHLPDDPEVLKNIILEANPKYRIVQLRKKLYACI